MREFDIVLYGATGFTGRQCVKYFLRHAPPELRWAIAGRSRVKLDQLQANVPAIVADGADPQAVDAMVRRTRIVLSTAGPFELYSSAVVDACVRFGSHYVDLSGETLWQRSLIERYHERAAAEGTRIIPACGFESAVSDMGAVWMARRTGAIEVKAYFENEGGAPNGGTVATGFHLARSYDERFEDPFVLVPGAAREPRPLEIDPSAAQYDADIGSWVTPFFFMGPINVRVVRRSCALLGLDFAYQEFSKASGRAVAYAASARGAMLSRSLSSPFVRDTMQRMAPGPGTGPSEETMENGWFRCDLFARAADGRTSRAVVAGKGDPSNRVSVKCLCESALALAGEEDALPARGGLLTPASGIGEVLRERLQVRGITFEAAS